MLDQNTDRMWYVIGAVIIGAAIILIMNNVFPQLFASVGETFKGKTEQTTEIVDGIMPVKRGEPLAFDMNVVEPWNSGMLFERVTTTSIRIDPNTNYMGGVYIPTHYFEMGKSYTVAFDITKLTGDVQGLGGHLKIASEATVSIDGRSTKLWSKGAVGDGKNDWTKTIVYPNDGDKHHVEVTFTVDKIAEDANQRFYIQPNRTTTLADFVEHGLDYSVVIEDLMLYVH